MALAPAALAQPRAYIGFVYPAGGQQGTTFQIRLGGQGLDDVNAVLVTGTGVTARVVDYYRRLDNQELQLLSEQARNLRRETMSTSGRAEAMAAGDPAMMSASSTNVASPTDAASPTNDPASVASKRRRRWN